jgi:hypothetical protein
MEHREASQHRVTMHHVVSHYVQGPERTAGAIDRRCVFRRAGLSSRRRERPVKGPFQLRRTARGGGRWNTAKARTANLGMHVIVGIE